MVSNAPNIQYTDYSFMYDIPDLRKPVTDFDTKPGSLMGLLQKNRDFSLFKYMVDLADMEGILNDNQANFTMFVPSNEFLKHLPAGIFTNMDKGTARDIVQFNMLHRRIPYSLLSASPAIYYNTLNRYNSMILCETINGKTTLNGCAKIIQPDVHLNNGIIHVVDNLIRPYPII